MKKNELAVATKNQVVANVEKDNRMLSLSEVHVALQKATEGSRCKVFTDQKYYSGIGVKANGFSVNVKKTKYNIYCSDQAFEAVSGLKVKDCTFTKNGNSADRTRPNSIECKNTESLLVMVKAVLSSVYIPATDTN